MDVGKAAKTGSNPGVTKSLSTIIKVLESPEVYIYDTPGGIRDDVAELETMADYLLFRLNNFGNTNCLFPSSLFFDFGTRTRIIRKAPTDDLEYFLEKVAKRIGALQPGGIPNTTLAAQFFIQQYRRGSFGQYCLDDINESSVLEALGLINKSDDISKNQLKKQEKEARKAKSLEKFKRAKEKSS
ncbi:Mitochondrial GTPase 1 [Zancudomyces culisetae]|uniref:Mitochondrial GTPase 1 n=1 Tax=Zancudomyces culisetae TaxID=1213189 RepID=A0A1R1PGJ1_ZANCU|nr:Mitochondrial GTPase 1 [Zancudomyces culisetae]|eukprot:OMH80033.1 Mitochondrial GTPase 1 [Zancudomyces culisetae]